ncbi:MAG: hypothetical protein LVR00_07415 [Rhabdochlamydiaceae bacterium]|jgi:hypothetical protein
MNGVSVQPFMQYAHFLAEAPVSHLLVSWAFLATIPWAAGNRAPTKTHHYCVFTGNLLGKVATVAAFLIEPISLPTRLKTTALALPFFKQIGRLPLSPSHVLATMTALVAILQIKRYIQGTLPQSSEDKVEKFGHFLSAIAFASIGTFAFNNIGTWKKTATAALIFFGAFQLSKAPIAIIKALILNDLTNRPYEYVLQFGISPILMALIGLAFTKLSWLPKSGTNLTATFIGLGCSLYVVGRIFITPSPDRSDK